MKRVTFPHTLLLSLLIHGFLVFAGRAMVAPFAEEKEEEEALAVLRMEFFHLAADEEGGRSSPGWDLPTNQRAHEATAPVAEKNKTHRHNHPWREDKTNTLKLKGEEQSKRVETNTGGLERTLAAPRSLVPPEISKVRGDLGRKEGYETADTDTVASPRSKKAPAPHQSTELEPLLVKKIWSIVKEAMVYPPAALRNGIQGTATISFRISLDGTAEEVEVATSSGFAILDNAAILAVKRGKNYPPTEKKVVIPVTFAIK